MPVFHNAESVVMNVLRSAVLTCALTLTLCPMTGAAFAQTSPPPPAASGDRPPDARIDSSTEQEAAKALTAAGFRDLKMLQKGFDSVWHFTATRDGKPVFVSWSRDGGAHLEEQ